MDTETKVMLKKNLNKKLKVFFCTQKSFCKIHFLKIYPMIISLIKTTVLKGALPLHFFVTLTHLG